MKPRLRTLFLLALAAMLLAVPPAAAQYYDDPYDADERDDGIRQSVARVSWFQGGVSFNRGDDPDDWQPASINYPMTLGDRIWAARDARVELQLRGGTVYLAPESELAALDLARDVRQLSLNLGTASFRIRRMERDEIFEVATPNVSVTFDMPGIYRIDVDEQGNSRVSVTQGRAWAAAAGGQVSLERGEQVRVWGIDRPGYDVVRLPRADRWDRWVEQRARRYRSVVSASYVHPDIYGIDDLDAYGSWENSAEYGYVWYPRGIAAGWEPYRYGRWIWRDPWGWTWLSSEPWGWAPYHYGRWAVARGRWCWVPVGPKARYPGYAPAVVGFVGGGAGWSISVSAGGFVGWFPLGPREPFDPWWYHARSRPNVASFNYAYRGRVTVVSRDVFVRGGRVERDIVRDTRVVNDISRAPVLRGPIPVIPTRASIRVSTSDVPGRSVVRPPEQIGRREVVTRSIPPPAPPSFDRKLEVIRERGGEPVTADVAVRLSSETRRGETRVQPVRPAGGDGVVLAPRSEGATTRKPQPLPPAAERPRETVEPPVRRDEAPPARVPEPRREVEPAPPTDVPRPIDAPAPPPVRERAPAPPPVRERAPAPRPEPRWEPAPTPAAPAAVPERRDVPRPPERNLDRPSPAPTPRVETLVAPDPRRPHAGTVPVTAAPVETDVRKAEPRRSSPEKAEPKKAEPKSELPDEVDAKPTPTPKVGDAPPKRRVDPGRGNG